MKGERGQKIFGTSPLLYIKMLHRGLGSQTSYALETKYLGKTREDSIVRALSS